MPPLWHTTLLARCSVLYLLARLTGETGCNTVSTPLTLAGKRAGFFDREGTKTVRFQRAAAGIQSPHMQAETTILSIYYLSNIFDRNRYCSVRIIYKFYVFRIIKKIREVNDEVIIMVDNCYGELVEKREPGDVGADLVVGSLMKNLGGGIASTGGYIAGNSDLVNLVAERLTAPGIGKEQGANFNLNNSFFKGVFNAPTAVNSALKTAIFSAYMLEKLGFDNVSPKYNQERTDIIQTVQLNSKENLVNFTQGIQSSSPIDSFVKVMAAPMPGYPFDEVMAAGSFTQGSTIELSADAPVVEPYTLYMQGGLSYQYGKLSILLALTNIKQN